MPPLDHEAVERPLVGRAMLADVGASEPLGILRVEVAEIAKSPAREKIGLGEEEAPLLLPFSIGVPELVREPDEPERAGEFCHVRNYLGVLASAREDSEVCVVEENDLGRHAAKVDDIFAGVALAFLAGGVETDCDLVRRIQKIELECAAIDGWITDIDTMNGLEPLMDERDVALSLFEELTEEIVATV